MWLYSLATYLLWHSYIWRNFSMLWNSSKMPPDRICKLSLCQIWWPNKPSFIFRQFHTSARYYASILHNCSCISAFHFPLSSTVGGILLLIFFSTSPIFNMHHHKQHVKPPLPGTCIKLCTDNVKRSVSLSTTAIGRTYSAFTGVCQGKKNSRGIVAKALKAIA